MNPLTSVKGSLITGFVLAILFAVLAVDGGWNELGLARWLHIISGITWIGLLYYFNAVQVPALAEAAADKGGPGGAGIAKYVAPRALLWFRWAAVATWFTGAWYLLRAGTFVDAFALGTTGDAFSVYGLVIGVGAWLGTIMLFNVWVFIWPNQKKILGLAPATDEQKAAARKTALYASRINYILSIPMLLCMAGATHGLPF
ncbi:MAG TPA: urate hydroxylase PuuD [Steroidobacteraceae bacterium]